MPSSYFITTAIDYVNGKPHLGHAYEKVLTDFLARFRRRSGDEVFFLTGVDEHGLKVQQSAQKEGVEPQVLCDRNATLFRELYDRLHVSYDDFIRTTEDRHKSVVRLILQKLHDAGEIYSGEYEGHYSPKQEQFLTEKDMVDGRFPEEYGEVIRLKEPVYFFRLEKHRVWLQQMIQEHPDWIFPAFRAREVMGALEQPIGDLCISRPKSRLAWGIPLPFDESQVTYVWFDALINYISAPGYDGRAVDARWPAVHVIGKDILVPAHAVYWPIMLKALGLPLPKQLLVHGFWLRNQEKMSKSVGNVVDPLDVIGVYGPDAFRYFVLREMALGQDADFSPEQFHQRYQSELGNNLGNLVNRAVSMVARYREGVVPSSAPETAGPEEAALHADVLEAVRAYRSGVEKLQIHMALAELWKAITRANQYAEASAPWKLAKDPAQAARLDRVLHELVAVLQLLLGELEPLIPGTVARACGQLGGLAPAAGTGEPTWPAPPAGHRLGAPEPLFPRVETADVAKPA
jgi:methionyl-tRNA synthetase